MPRAGHVVTIRVNPEDCQGVLDVMRVLNVDPYDGRSFAVCVSLALSSMLVSLRKSGVTPEIDHFQYLNRMGPFLKARNDKRKKSINDGLYSTAMHGVSAPAIPSRHPGQFIPDHIQETQGWTEAGPVTTAAVPMLMDEGTRMMLEDRLQEIRYKMQSCPEGLTEEEVEEFNRLSLKLDPPA
jgi:hypothetical protein